MSRIKLIALDLDGTLFNYNSRITPMTAKALKAASNAGVHIVASTGRPAVGLPMEEIGKTDIRYAITTNGAGIYRIDPRECICEDCMEPELLLPIVEFLQTKDIHTDAFIHGKAYSLNRCKEIAYKLDLPESVRHYMIDTRIRVEDLAELVRTEHLPVQKMTLNFYPLKDGTRKDRQEVREFLLSNPRITCTSGGFGNLEFTRAGVTKGTGLKALADHLNISMDETMAIGDSENDIPILKTAAVGIAMGNAVDEVKAVADDITDTNDRDGVAKAIQKYVL